jgi:hypothetical protein
LTHGIGPLGQFCDERLGVAQCGRKPDQGDISSRVSRPTLLQTEL